MTWRTIDLSAKTAGYTATPHILGPKPLWGKKGFKLPNYIENVAKGLIESGHDESTAIQMAIGAVKRWASGGGKVSPEVRAASAAAVAEWEKLKASAHTHSRTGAAIELNQVASAAGAARYNLPIGTQLGQNGQPVRNPQLAHLSDGQLIAAMQRATGPDNADAAGMLRAELAARGYSQDKSGKVVRGQTGNAAFNAHQTALKTLATSTVTAQKANAAAQTKQTNAANAASKKASAQQAAAAKKAANAKAVAARRAAAQKAAAQKKAARGQAAASKKATAAQAKAAKPHWFARPAGQTTLDLSTVVGMSGDGPRVSGKMTNRYGQALASRETGQLASHPTGDDSNQAGPDDPDQGSGVWVNHVDVHEPRGPRSADRKLGTVQRRSGGTGVPFRAVGKDGKVISYHHSAVRAAAAITRQGG